MGFGPLAQCLACRCGPTLPGVGSVRDDVSLAVLHPPAAEAVDDAQNQHPFTVPLPLVQASGGHR
jgi:hypothetical protein